MLTRLWRKVDGRAEAARQSQILARRQGGSERESTSQEGKEEGPN